MSRQNQHESLATISHRFHAEMPSRFGRLKPEISVHVQPQSKE